MLSYSLNRPLKKMVLGNGQDMTHPYAKLSQNIPIHHWNAFLDALSENSCFSVFALHVLKEPKRKLKTKDEKSMRGWNFSHLPTPSLCGGYLFSMWGRTADVIKHDKFKLNQFWAFGAPDRRKLPSPIDLAHRPYNSVRTTVLHCDKHNHS